MNDWENDWNNAHYGRHDITNINIWATNFWSIISAFQKRMQATLLEEPEYVGTHRCWVGDSGDYINGECNGKPHMWFYYGHYILIRQDGTGLRFEAIGRPQDVVVTVMT